MVCERSAVPSIAMVSLGFPSTHQPLPGARAIHATTITGRRAAAVAFGPNQPGNGANKQLVEHALSTVSRFRAVINVPAKPQCVRRELGCLAKSHDVVQRLSSFQCQWHWSRTRSIQRSYILTGYSWCERVIKSYSAFTRCVCIFSLELKFGGLMNHARLLLAGRS